MSIRGNLLENEPLLIIRFDALYAHSMCKRVRFRKEIDCTSLFNDFEPCMWLAIYHNIKHLKTCGLLFIFE